MSRITQVLILYLAFLQKSLYVLLMKMMKKFWLLIPLFVSGLSCALGGTSARKNQVTDGQNQKIVIGKQGICFFKENQGIGPVVPQKRLLPAFTRISNQGMINIHLVAGQPTSEALVEAQENLLPKITTEVIDGQLVISTKDSICTQETMAITVFVPQVTEIVNKGAGNIIGENIVATHFSVELSDYGGITLIGKAQSMNLQATGSGNLNLTKLIVPKLSFAQSGYGQIQACITEEAKGKASGSGAIEMVCDLKRFHVDMSGYGDVTLDGTVQDLKVGVGGSGSFIARHVTEGVVQINMSGYGSVTLDGTIKILNTTISGSGSLVAKKLQGNAVTVDMSNYGNVMLEGTMQTLKATVTGSGSLDARKLQVKKAEVTSTNYGSIQICAEEEISGSLSGSGNLTLACKPQINRVTASGYGTIQ